MTLPINAQQSEQNIHDKDDAEDHSKTCDKRSKVFLFSVSRPSANIQHDANVNVGDGQGERDTPPVVVNNVPNDPRFSSWRLWVEHAQQQLQETVKVNTK